jgi:hypothetical protein
MPQHNYSRCQWHEQYDMQDTTLYTASFLPWQQSVDLSRLRRPHSSKHFLKLATSTYGCPADRPPVPELKYEKHTIASGTSLYTSSDWYSRSRYARYKVTRSKRSLGMEVGPASRTISNLHFSSARRYSWLLSAREAPGDRHWS